MGVQMKVSRWGNSLAVRIPSKVAKELGIKEGDLVSREALGLRKVIPRIDRDEALERLTNKRWTLPEDWKIDRNDPDMRG